VDMATHPVYYCSIENTESVGLIKTSNIYPTLTVINNVKHLYRKTASRGVSAA
jgi:hypothetical protein